VSPLRSAALRRPVTSCPTASLAASPRCQRWSYASSGTQRPQAFSVPCHSQRCNTLHCCTYTAQGFGPYPGAVHAHRPGCYTCECSLSRCVPAAAIKQGRHPSLRQTRHHRVVYLLHLLLRQQISSVTTTLPGVRRIVHLDVPHDAACCSGHDGSVCGTKSGCATDGVLTARRCQATCWRDKAATISVRNTEGHTSRNRKLRVVSQDVLKTYSKLGTQLQTAFWRPTETAEYSRHNYAGSSK
jgi:hypothetical protein